MEPPPQWKCSKTAKTKIEQCPSLLFTGRLLLSVFVSVVIGVLSLAVIFAAFRWKQTYAFNKERSRKVHALSKERKALVEREAKKDPLRKKKANEKQKVIARAIAESEKEKPDVEPPPEGAGGVLIKRAPDVKAGGLLGVVVDDVKFEFV